MCSNTSFPSSLIVFRSLPFFTTLLFTGISLCYMCDL